MDKLEKQFGLKIAILSLSFLLMLRMTISPALAEIGKAFPAVSQEMLMMMVVLPSLVAILFGFLSGVLAGFFKVKNILYVALVLFLIGGVGPVFTKNFTMIIWFRGLLGVGTGLFLPFTAGLIAAFFRGNERNQMIGFQSSAVGVGNIITSLLAGLLAAIAWNLSFLIYGFAFISLVLVVVKIPEPPKVLDEQSKVKGVSVNRGVMLVCFGILLYSIVYFAFFGYLSFIIDTRNLGDSKASGLATMLMTLGALIMGILFGKLVRFFKRYTLFVALVGNFLGFCLLAWSTTLVHVFIGSTFVGLGFGLLMPFAMMRLNEASDRSALNFSNALFMTFINIGTAAAPKILVTIGEIFNNPDGQFIFAFCAGCLAVAAILILINIWIPNKFFSCVPSNE